tara:strand:+ start:86 stop:451 length:366 start_codon:yes stop_codon:yes gene_type:complete
MAFERRQQSDASLGYADLRVFIDIIDQEWEMDGLSDDGALRARPTRANMPARFQNDAHNNQPARASLFAPPCSRASPLPARCIHSNCLDVAIPGQYVDQADDDGGACVCCTSPGMLPHALG